MQAITDILRHHSELAVFLTLAGGFVIGKFRVGSFTLGPMLGTLFAGMVLGLLDIPIAPIVKTIFFDLFLFATGYKVGPQFFYGLKKEALPQLALTFVICTTCLLTAVVISKLLGYDVGTAAGLLAGAFSESTVIGTAGDAIQKLALPDAEKVGMVNNIPVAYAVTYLVGTTANVWFLSTMAPKLMRVNLKEEGLKLAKKFGADKQESDDLNLVFKEWSLRAFRLNAQRWAGKSVKEFEEQLPGKRIMVERIKKPTGIVDPAPDIVLEEGDLIVVASRHAVMLEMMSTFGEEIFDREMLDFPLIHLEMTVSRKELADKTLGQLAAEYGQGIMLSRLMRSGQELPFESGTVIHLGDVLYISGREKDVKRTAEAFGFVERDTVQTDIIFVSIGIVLGGLIGMLAFSIGGIAITLSTSGGALVMGLVFGWFHARHPKIGRIPEPALWLFDTMGLATFLGIVGLAAGPTFISGLKATGVTIIFAGLVVALLPHIIGMFFGKYVLRMNPLILLGAQSGAGTTTTALKAIQDAAQSKHPVLGYTIPYALGNILLTAWGPVIVSLMTM